MKTSLMQKLDGYAGPPLCWLLSLFSGKKKAFPARVEKILIVKMFGLGSMIIMTPMIRSIRDTYPSARIYFMTFKEHGELCRHYRMCDEVLGVRRSNLWYFFIDTLNIIRRVNNEKFDIVIDAEFFSRYTALFISFCRRSFNIGFYNPNMYRGSFLDRRCYFNQYYHMKENFMELVRFFASTDKGMSLTCPDISEEASKRVEGLLKDSGFLSQPVIIMNPNTSDITSSIDRSWPIDNFALLGKELLRKGYKIIIVGSSGQKARSEALAKMCGDGAKAFAGNIGLEELIALIGRAFCVITNDSAPLHIAVSQNVPTFSFFGTDTPRLYGSDEPIHTHFFKGLACSPCLSVFNYKHGQCDFQSACLRKIGHKEVLGEFEKKETLLKDEYHKRGGR